MLLAMQSWMLMLQFALVGVKLGVGQCIADAAPTSQGDAMLQQASKPHSMQQHELLEDAATPKTEAEKRIQPVQEIVLSKVDVTEKKPMRVAVFAQAYNLLLLPELQQCITNVAAAQDKTGGNVDVYLSTPSAKPDEIPTITESLKKATPALGRLEVRITANKGADMGQLLQQMQSAANSGRDYDTILKIHTKTKEDVRRYILDTLCGTVDNAEKIIASFATNPSLGLAGADGFLVWRGIPDGSPRCGLVWNIEEVENMRRIWAIISPDTPMPPEDAWTCSVTDFWWSRGSSVTSNPVLLPATTRLLDSMQFGYVSGSTGRPEHALERLIATMVRAAGGVVAHVIPEVTWSGGDFRAAGGAVTGLWK